MSLVPSRSVLGATPLVAGNNICLEYTWLITCSRSEVDVGSTFGGGSAFEVQVLSMIGAASSVSPWGFAAAGGSASALACAALGGSAYGVARAAFGGTSSGADVCAALHIGCAGAGTSNGGASENGGGGGIGFAAAATV